MPTTSTPTTRPRVTRRWADLELVEFRSHGRDVVIKASSPSAGEFYTRRCTKFPFEEFLVSWGWPDARAIWDHASNVLNSDTGVAVLDYAFNRLDVK